MAVDVILPKVDMDMESAIIESWKVVEGQRVEKGDILFEIITNKAAMEIDAPASGVIGAIAGVTGEPIPVGAVVARIFAEGEAIAPLAEPSQPRAPAASARVDRPAIAVAARAPEQPGGAAAAGLRATPLARRLAREKGVDLSRVVGRGPRGRIAEADVRLALEAPEQRAAADLIPFDPVRRIAAARLAESMRNAPHFYMTAEMDMTAFDAALELARRQAREGGWPRPGPTVFLAHLVARALKSHPMLRASVEGSAYRLHDSIDLAIAVDRDGALITPVLRDAGTKSLPDLSADFARLVAAARARTIKPSELTGGVFTISNLGMFGVDAFTAIINPPQSAILAVGRTQDKPVGRDGQIVLRPVATFTLSSDHRIVDGAAASRFMADLRAAVEAAQV